MIVKRLIQPARIGVMPATDWRTVAGKRVRRAQVYPVTWVPHAASGRPLAGAVRVRPWPSTEGPTRAVGTSGARGRSSSTGTGRRVCAASAARRRRACAAGPGCRPRAGCPTRRRSVLPRRVGKCVEGVVAAAMRVAGPGVEVLEHVEKRLFLLAPLPEFRHHLGQRGDGLLDNQGDDRVGREPGWSHCGTITDPGFRNRCEST